MDTRVILYARQGCHLCGPARDVVRRVCDELGAGWREVDIDVGDSAIFTADDGAQLPGEGSAEALLAKYSDYVPVVVVDGVPQGFWEVDETRLRRAVEAPPQS